TALNQRVESNEHDAAVWSASGGADSLFDPKYYFPYSWAAFYATTWGQWFTNDTHPEDPSEAAKRQMDLYQQVFATVDAPTRLELMRVAMPFPKEEFFTTVVMQPTSDSGLVNRLMGNFPGVDIASTEYEQPGAATPEQFNYEAE